jgi:ketosteroid isomerase-like protein
MTTPCRGLSLSRWMLKRSVTITILCVVACACMRQRDQSDAERYIIESERQWAESVATGDASVVERILADDFVGVDPKGRLYDKATMVSDTRDAPNYFVSNRANEIKVRFYGDAAVAQGSETWERRTGDPLRGRFVWTDTWLRRNGKWQIVAAEDLVAPEQPATP